MSVPNQPRAPVPPDVVRMGSRVRYRTGRDERQVVLTYPAEADISERRISVLTPIGTPQDFLVVDRGGDGVNLEVHVFPEPWEIRLPEQNA